MKKPKIKETPPPLIPTGKKLSAKLLRHIEKGRAAAKERIKQREKEKALEKHIIEQRRKAS